MTFILTTKMVQGRRIEFDGSNKHDDWPPFSTVGSEMEGELSLQTFDNSDKLRLTFSDFKNVGLAGLKKLFGEVKAVYNDDPVGAFVAGQKNHYLCAFDFTISDLRNGRKKINYNMIEGYSCLCCYDYGCEKGVFYRFWIKDDCDTFARRLEISRINYISDDGRIERHSYL